MLTQVGDGVWVRQSGWVWTNSIVVRGEDGLVLVDPGIDGSELNQLADVLVAGDMLSDVLIPLLDWTRIVPSSSRALRAAISALRSLPKISAGRCG